MRAVLLTAALLLCCSSPRAQTISLARVKKAENLKTVDSVGAVKPCNGITENLTLSDSLGAVARTPVLATLAESVIVSDSIAVAYTFTFPKNCSLSMFGNIVTCLLSGGP